MDSNQKKCPISKCIFQCNARVLVAALVAFIPLFTFDFYYHNTILMPTYESIAPLCRTDIEILQNFKWEIARLLGISFVLAHIFSKYYGTKGLCEGLGFGFAAGLVMGLVQFGNYSYLPIPMHLANAWFLGGVIEGVIVGFMLSLINAIYSHAPTKPSV